MDEEFERLKEFGVEIIDPPTVRSWGGKKYDIHSEVFLRSVQDKFWKHLLAIGPTQEIQLTFWKNYFLNNLQEYYRYSIRDLHTPAKDIYADEKLDSELLPSFLDLEGYDK